MKKIIAILAAIMLLCSLTSCSMVDAFVEGFKQGWEESTTQTFRVQEMFITLKGLFSQQDDLNETFDGVFVSLNSGVLVARYTYEDLGYDTDPALNVDEFAQKYADLIDTEVAVASEDGVVYFTESMDVEGTDFTYFYTFFVSETAYWCVQMYCPTEDFEEMRPNFIEWAQSVTFAAPTV